jgi:hypothetical protein
MRNYLFLQNTQIVLVRTPLGKQLIIEPEKEMGTNIKLEKLVVRLGDTRDWFRYWQD